MTKLDTKTETGKCQQKDNFIIVFYLELYVRSKINVDYMCMHVFGELDYL